jgi:hypothetical protein
MCPKQALAGATSGMGRAAALHSEAAPSSKQPRHPSINHKHTQGPPIVRPLFKGMHMHACLNTTTGSQASSAPTHALPPACMPHTSAKQARRLLASCMHASHQRQASKAPAGRCTGPAHMPDPLLALAYYAWHRYSHDCLRPQHTLAGPQPSAQLQSTPPRATARHLLLLYLPTPS